MKYSLVRILGNDQPPRHSIDQTRRNTEFILKHEPEFRNCDKYFILNRIWNPVKYNQLVSLIEPSGYKILTIPFIADDYLQLTDDDSKFLYLTNQNEARNFAITELLDTCDVLLPFDGGTCFRSDGWQQLLKGIEGRDLEPYYTVPMWRLKSLKDYKMGRPTVKEKAGPKTRLVEPQICFTAQSDKMFTEGMTYGKANKVDMLWMLDVPGPWQAWHPSLHEIARTRMSKYAGSVRSCGFVCRLPSGNTRGDHNIGIRSRLRQLAVNKTLESVDNFIKNKKV